MIKTIKLTGTEQAVTFAGRFQYFHVHNLGGGEVLASLTAGVTRGKDDVKIFKSGGAGYLQVDAATDTIYLAGTGEVQVEGTGNAFPPSFSGAPKGGDEIISEGGTITAVTVDYPIVELNLYGKSVQDGTPTPETPVDIVSVGDDGSVTVTACGKNVFPWNDYTTAPFQPNTLTSWERTSDEISVVPDAAKVASGFCIWNSQVNKNFYACDGKTITLSCEVWAESETALRIGIENIKLQKFTVGNAWQKCSVTLDFMLSTSGKTIAWYANYSDVPFKVRNIQVEIGSVATDYEPYKGNTAEITSGLPLCSVGDVCDELIYNADGTGKIIKRTRRTPLSSQYNWTMSANPPRFGYAAGITGADISSGYASAISEFFSDCRIYSTWIDIFTDYFADLDEFKAFLDANEVYVYYPLATPEIIELSSAEMAALAELQTFEGVTNIYNDEGTEMLVKVATNPLLSEYVKPVIDGITARFEARIAALESAITNT